MRRWIAGLFVIVLSAWSAAALADWDETMAAKWVQFPDETVYGIDVNASYGFILADDFECTEAGPIKDIHIWASWLNDYLPMGDPDAVRFTLSIHSDIPASESPTGYSMPGEVLWYRDFQPGEFTARIWIDYVEEGWMDPPESYIFPGDFVIWQYNFYIPDGEEFWQQGTPDEPVVYWLDVKAEPFDGAAMLGWKTSRDHWNDDAVWGEGYEPYIGPWFELRYPPGHELWGESIDLAFVITGLEPSDLDWGDAPEPAGAPGYPTTAANNGANHVIAGPWLGDATDGPDPEFDGQPDPNALGDDTFDGNDDEDGVQIPPLMQGGTSTINFEVQGVNAWVVGWIDYNGDQSWDASEQVYNNFVAPGLYAVNVTVPSSAIVGQTFSRWRICSAFAPGPEGAAPDGEVEDHEVWIDEGQAYKWEQWPDLGPTGIDVNATAPYILADDFLCTEPGRIIEIDVWASWLNDWWPFGVDPEAVDFILSFHADIPDSESGMGYSMPGDVLWYHYFTPDEFTVDLYATDIEEGWMDPPDYYWFPADWTCWLYRFYVDPYEAFFQAGSEDGPIVYWLDVQAYPYDTDAWFGWKTSLNHWNDDGVWGDGFEPYFGPWFELRYPPMHELAGHSINLAFRLLNEPSSGVPTDRPTPEGFGLYQNIPNPFGATTTIRFSLPAAAHARLEVFDVTGRVVATLVDESRPAGINTVTWSGLDDAGRAVPAGVYFYRVVSGGNEMTNKMLYLK
jgi:hypothetical protein